MESKHTPGPWYVDTTDKEYPYSICQDNEHGWGIAEVKTFAPVGSDKANAALIAAAPEMYEALVDAARLVGLILAGDEAVDVADMEATYNGISAALAKATA
jgi:ATP-dependent phosphoenolpyruvate carboxykinase